MVKIWDAADESRHIGSRAYAIGQMVLYDHDIQESFLA
jgi:hypothetical protein